MIRAILGVLALGMVLTLNQAQAAVAAPSSAFDDFMRTVTGPGKQTISFGSNGTPVVAPGVPSLSSSGGALQMSRTGSLPLSGGARLPVTAAAKISSSAAGAMIKKALPYLPVVGQAAGILLLAHELAFDLSNDPATGAVVVTSSALSDTFTYHCYDGSVTSDPMTCIPLQQAFMRSSGSYPNCVLTFQYWGGSAYFQGVLYTPVMITQGSSCPNNGGPANRTKTGTQNVTTPRTLQDLADAIASQSGWPSSSAIAQAVVDAQKITGDKIPTDQPDVTGPATVVGPDEVTKSGNKETTKHTDFNCTYDNSAKFGQYGGSVSCSQKTTSTDRITDPNTGGVITVPGDETTQPVEPSPEDGPAIDTALPAQPTLYKRQYPDGLTGVWNAKKAELLATPLLQLTSNLQPTIAAPSGYPTWPVPVVIGRWNFGTYDVSPASYVWDFLKVCTIIGALFLARALIFGG